MYNRPGRRLYYLPGTLTAASTVALQWLIIIGGISTRHNVGNVRRKLFRRKIYIQMYTRTDVFVTVINGP